MGELAPLPALGGGVIPIRGPVVTGAVLVPIENSSKGQGAQARMDTAPQAQRVPQRARGEADETPRADNAQRIDDSTLLGPSPAFQANVLELERDLRRAIERLESERSRAEAEVAFKVEKAQADVEAAKDAKQSAETEAAAPVPDDTDTNTASPANAGDAQAPEFSGATEAETTS